MAKPNVFISSTYYDLKHIRSSLEQFVMSLGYDPILSEKGDIPYSSSIPLDESCYKQVQKCDIFVVIIGGRYGSEVSKTRGSSNQKEFFDAYDSVTKKEFDSAYNSDTPVYILVEKAVFSEYETFKRNSENETISYAHVDSVNIFRFIELVLSKPRNNPVFQFERESEIESWLKEQWAGLFKDMLTERGESKKLVSLSDKVTELGNINTTLKNYMESIITKLSVDDISVKNVIDEETKRLETQRVNDKLLGNLMFKGLLDYDLEIEKVKKIFIEAKSMNDLANALQEETDSNIQVSTVIPHWRKHSELVERIQEIRKLLGEEEINF